MSAPVIVIDEYNGLPITLNPQDVTAPTGGVGAVTLAIPQLVFASIDAPSTTPDLIGHTIPPNTNSFEKWLALRVASPAPATLTNVKLVFSQVAPIDSYGAPSLSVLYGVGAVYPTFGPVDTASTTAVRPTLKASVPLALDNTLDATSILITLQLQASLGAQPGAFVFPSDFIQIVFDWT